MKLDILSYHDLLAKDLTSAHATLENALLTKGVVGISDVPLFAEKRENYLSVARQFAELEHAIKHQYAPNRDSGQTEGYELGAEWFQTSDGQWQRDDKKASYYAFVPDQAQNIWPREIDLKTSYQELGELIFQTGKHLLNAIGLDERIGIPHQDLIGYGRLLHYYKEERLSDSNASWCGAHFDHGLFTGLIPSAYFKDGKEIEEPDEAGLHIVPTGQKDFVKVKADKSVLLFQVGEYGQLISNDRIRATKHYVKKASPGIERFSFALFYIIQNQHRIVSRSELVHDERYSRQQAEDGSVTYDQWAKASYERYRAT